MGGKVVVGGGGLGGEERREYDYLSLYYYYCACQRQNASSGFEINVRYQFQSIYDSLESEHSHRKGTLSYWIHNLSTVPEVRSNLFIRNTQFKCECF